MKRSILLCANHVSITTPETNISADINEGRRGSILRFLCTSAITREVLWVAVGQLVSVLGTVIGVRVVTGLVSPSTYGELALGGTITLIGQVVFLAPIANTASRYYAPASEATQLPAFFSAITRFSIYGVSALICFTAVGTVLLHMSGLSGPYTYLFGASCLLSLPVGIAGIADGILNAARRRKVVVCHQAAYQWLKFSTAVCSISIWQNTSLAVIGAYAVSSFGVVISQLSWLKRSHSNVNDVHSAENGDRVPTPQLWSYTWPFITWGVFSWAQQASDRWALQAFADTHTVGLYQSLYQIGYYPISLLTSVLTQLISPIVYARAGTGRELGRLHSARKITRTLTLATLVLTLLTSLVCAALHRPLFTLLVGPRYAQVSHFLPFMTLCAGLFAAAQIAILELFSCANSKKLIAPKIITCGIGVSANYLGAYLHGIEGLIVAGVIFAVIYLAWAWCLLDKVSNVGHLDG